MGEIDTHALQNNRCCSCLSQLRKYFIVFITKALFPWFVFFPPVMTVQMCSPNSSKENDNLLLHRLNSKHSMQCYNNILFTIKSYLIQYKNPHLAIRYPSLTVIILTKRCRSNFPNLQQKANNLIKHVISLMLQ